MRRDIGFMLSIPPTALVCSLIGVDGSNSCWRKPQVRSERHSIAGASNHTSVRPDALREHLPSPSPRTRLSVRTHARSTDGVR